MYTFCCAIVITSLFCYPLVLIDDIQSSRYAYPYDFSVKVYANDFIAAFSGGGGFNHINVYKQPGRVIVNTYTDGSFFCPRQYVIQTEEQVAKDNIAVVWIDGKKNGKDHLAQTQSTQLIAHITITVKGEIIFDEYKSFVDRSCLIGGE